MKGSKTVTSSRARAARYSGNCNSSSWLPLAITPTAVEEHHTLGERDRLDAVGDDHGGAAFHRLHQPAADRRLGGRVDGAHRVVEHEHARVAQDGSSDGEALALTAGEAVALRADDRVVAVGKLTDERVGFGEPGGTHNFAVVRLRVADGEVRTNARREHDCVFEHE